MSVEVTQRADGLTIATDFMPGIETVSLGCWVGAGTRHEVARENGISHFLEHMAFKGTKRRDAYAIAEEIEAVGGYLNACTSRENTAYYAKVLKNDLPLAVDIIADILQNPIFDGEELERERMVILQEIGQALDTPDDIIFDHFQEIAYPNQALGRPVLGPSSIVEVIGEDDLKRYMTQHYRANRMVISAAGALDHQTFCGLVDQAFAGLAGEGIEELEPAAYAGGQYLEERDLEQVHVVLGLQSVSMHHEDYFAINLLASILGGGMASRLFQEVREKRGLAYAIYSFNSSFLDDGLFGIYAGTGPDDLDPLLAVLSEELRRLPDSLEASEIERAKTQSRASLLMSREGSSSRCDLLAQQILVYGRPLTNDEVLERIDGVEQHHLVSCAQRLLESEPTLAVMGRVPNPPDLNLFRESLRG